MNMEEKTTVLLTKGLKDIFNQSFEELNSEMKKLPSTVVGTKTVGKEVKRIHEPLDMGHNCSAKITDTDGKETLNEQKVREKFVEFLKPVVDAKHVSTDDKQAILDDMVDRTMEDCKVKSKPFKQVTITLSDEFKLFVNDFAKAMVELGVKETEMRTFLLDSIKKQREKL